MNRFLQLCLILSLLSLSACCAINRPTPQQINDADVGEYPYDYEQIIQAYYSTGLFDPYSAHYRWVNGPYKGCFCTLGVWEYGYIVEYGLNAKNRFGGYVGEEQFGAMIKNGRVVAVKPLWMKSQ